MYNEKLQANFLILEDIIALHFTDVCPEYSLLIPVRAKNPQEVWGASLQLSN